MSIHERLGFAIVPGIQTGPLVRRLATETRGFADFVLLDVPTEEDEATFHHAQKLCASYLHLQFLGLFHHGQTYRW